MRRLMFVGFLFPLAGAAWGQFETGWAQPGISGDVAIDSSNSVRVLGKQKLTYVSFQGDVGYSSTFSMNVVVGTSRDVIAGTSAAAPYAAEVQRLSPSRPWTYTLDSPGDDEASAITAFDNSVVAAITTNIETPAGTKRGIAVVRLNATSGAVEWVKTLDVHPLVDNGRAVDIAYSDNSLFVFGVGDVGRESRAVIFRLNANTGGVTALVRPPASSRATSILVDSERQVYVASGAGLCRIDGSVAATSMPLVWSTPYGGASPVKFGGTVYSTDHSTIYATSASGVSVPIFGGLPPEDFISKLYTDSRGRLYVHLRYLDGELGYFSYIFTALDPASGEVRASMSGSFEELEGATTDSQGTTYLSSSGPGGAILKELYQTPEPMDDIVQVDADRSVYVVKPGLMANDAYTNPFKCSVSLVSGPYHGTLDLKRDGGFQYQPDPGFVGTDTFRYLVTRGSLSGEAEVFLNVERGLTLALAKTVVAGQNTVKGTIILARTADYPTVVSLQSNNSSASVPPTAIIPTRALSKDFTIYTKPVAAQTNVQITATFSIYSHAQTLTLKPLVPTSVIFTPSRVLGGTSVTTKILIDGVAGPGGLSLNLTSTSPHAQIPSSVTVPAGASSVSFAFATSAPSVSTLATITASVPTGQKVAYLRVDP